MFSLQSVDICLSLCLLFICLPYCLTTKWNKFQINGMLMTFTCKAWFWFCIEDDLKTDETDLTFVPNEWKANSSWVLRDSSSWKLMICCLNNAKIYKKMINCSRVKEPYAFRCEILAAIIFWSNVVCNNDQLKVVIIKKLESNLLQLHSKKQ